MPEKVKVRFELDDAQAWAMAKLINQLRWRDVRRCAADEAETCVMVCALAVVRAGLAAAGYELR